ncbi:MAG: 30S ribosomal protein S12 [Candidatus Diapherotrites archaeon CG08_land_8_20_14_0_20_30_16]|nr:MAG: 30S ribosomal protein S12 [Candidatus Diapherotrites archaeon CG08_land_8_20_14_0_20_30_16]
MSNGEFAARKMLKSKKMWRKKSAKYMKKWKRDTGTLKDPLQGAPMKSGIVLLKRTVEAKQPNSGLRKCVRVQLSNGIKVTALAPKDGAIKYIDQHDEVTVSGINGSKGGPKGDLWGVSYKVEKVNGISLEQLRRGKKEKAKR